MTQTQTLPPVPYIPQRGNAPANDCGPACCLMLARWNGRAMNVSVAEWSRKYDPADDGTTSATLQTILRIEAGLTPISGTVAYPYIQLVDYATLPILNRSDQSGDTFLHWIVRLGDTTYHDPYHFTNRGANLSAPRAVLDAARRLGGGPPVSITERPIMSNGEPRVQYGRVVNVLPPDAPVERCVAVLKEIFAAKQTLGFSYDDAGVGNLDDRTAVLWDIPQGERAAFASFYAQYYPGVKVAFKPDAAPPPVPEPTPTPTGVSFARHLGVSALIDARAGQDALARGCRAVLFLNNTGAAIDAARQYPDAITFMRVWWGSKLTPQQMASALDAHRSDIPRNCYATVLNECDTWCYGSPAEMTERFNVERETAEIIWRTDPNRVVCIGQFSHGTPDITRADIRQAWRDTYGAFAIANKHRIRIGWHLYTKGRRYTSHPPQGADIYDPIWFEGRDNEFWKQTGMPADARCICDETGVEAGAGGFNWAQYNAQQFAEWSWWWLDYTAQKFVRHDAMVIFQFGDHPGWQGYDCRYLIEVLTGLWQNRIPRPAAPRDWEPFAYAPEPAYEVPLPKLMMPPPSPSPPTTLVSEI